MTDKPRDYSQEVRDTVLKSGLTGVAATVLAVAFFSPAGVGGMVGTSLASGFGLDPSTRSTNDPYARLPPYPAPLTARELSEIHDDLARATASLAITRAATDAKIENLRSLAVSADAVTFTPMQQTAEAEELRPRMSAPASFAAAMPAAAAAPAAAEEAFAPIQTPRPIEAEPISQGFVGVDPSFRDPHMELAELLRAYESF